MSSPIAFYFFYPGVVPDYSLFSLRDQELFRENFRGGCSFALRGGSISITSVVRTSLSGADLFHPLKYHPMFCSIIIVWNQNHFHVILHSCDKWVFKLILNNALYGVPIYQVCKIWRGQYFFMIRVVSPAIYSIEIICKSEELENRQSLPPRKATVIRRP